MRADVAFGSLADIPQRNRDVRFTPKSGHSRKQTPCPLCAKSRHRGSLLDHLVSPLRSWRREESQVESSENQDNANIHYQPFPESVSEEHEIYTDYNGCHRHHVKHHSYPSVHFSTTSFHFLRSGRVTPKGMDGISDHSRDCHFVRNADIPARGARQKKEGAEAPAGSGSVSRGFSWNN
jgi:hypothetical protein